MTLFALLLILAFIIFFWIFHDLIGSFIGILVIFILAWLLWYATGGVDRFEKSNQGIFIRPIGGYKGFETYGSFPEIPVATSTQR